MKKTDKKSYYAIIPAEVRYDQSLSANAKLLYGEITALCSEKGFCWATNSYFAGLYKKDVVTISRWIAQLIDKKYITSVIDKAEGNKRQLHLSVKMSIPINKNANTLLTKMPIPINKNAKSLLTETPIPINKNVKHNIKDNTTENIKDNKGISQEQDLSSKQSDGHYACTLLKRYGVDDKVARSIVYDQHTPLSSIENVIKNGLAKEESGGFVLEAGYIIEALNKAHHEGKIVGPTKLSKKLAAKLSIPRKERSPPSPAEIQKRKRRIRSQVAAMNK